MKASLSFLSRLQRLGRGFQIALVLTSALLLSACGAEPSGSHAEEQARLNQARSLWKSQSLSDYSFVFSRSCFCTPEFREPVTITVRSGTITSVVSVESGAVRSPAQYQTVEGLFSVVQDAIDKNAASIRVEYDSTRGYLRSAYIDLDVRMADEEISIEAKSLTPGR